MRFVAFAALFLALPLHAEEVPLEVRVLLVPEREAVLSAELSERIIEMPFEEGARFQKGDVLVALDCRLHQAHLNEARALLRGAEKTLANKRELAALQSTGELEVALAGVERDRARAQVAAADILVKRCAITAPFAGRVVETHAKLHESAAAGDKLLSILDDSRLRLELVVPSHWLGWLHEGAKFSLRVDETGSQHQGRVTLVGARVDAISQSVKVFGELSTDAQGLMAGMSGTALFEDGGAGQ